MFQSVWRFYIMMRNIIRCVNQYEIFDIVVLFAATGVKSGREVVSY